MHQLRSHKITEWHRIVACPHTVCNLVAELYILLSIDDDLLLTRSVGDDTRDRYKTNNCCQFPVAHMPFHVYPPVPAEQAHMKKTPYQEAIAILHTFYTTQNVWMSVCMEENISVLLKTSVLY